MRVAPRCAAYKMTLIALVLLAYLLGSVSFGVLASRIFHLPDPRSYGSKNPGATNVLRSGKKTAAAFTLLGDAGKGWVAVVLARYAGPIPGVDMDATAPVALAVFLGHLFPVFLGFKGGKGVATALGVLLGFNPWMGLLSAASWIIGCGSVAYFVVGGVGGGRSCTHLRRIFSWARCTDPDGYHHVLAAHLAA